MDKHDLYEMCAQSPERDAPLLAAIHGANPTLLGEDFAGSGATSRAWARLIPGGSAVAVDHDAGVLERAAPNKDRDGGVTVRAVDVMDADDPCDVLFVGNFSVCEIHTRPELLKYLRHARSRLRPGGIIACDLYGGSDAYTLGTLEDDHEAADGSKISYTWEQRHGDPATARVVNAMHFIVEAPGGGRTELRDAFVYDWRLWTIMELREAMLEAGFSRTEVYPRAEFAEDDEGVYHTRPIEHADELDEAFFVFVVGRA